ncbi:tRNA 2-thiouridine(34) synthase MnmA [Patescibacteria group bacterium]|nr:tRNA 2-thiouridine(34) synthase MnmA [Patescibacteria group bacterium]
MENKSGKLKKRVLLEMSGGVDSATSLIFLLKKGYEVIGVSFLFPKYESTGNISDIEIARSICEKFNINHYIENCEESFEKNVVSYFKEEINKGKTPNPCIICNKEIKIKFGIELLEKYNADYIATGHYAKNVLNKRTKKYELQVAKDKNKDQTYFLFNLNQNQLQKIIFPLENAKKKNLRKVLIKKDIEIFKDIKESNDFCYFSSEIKKKDFFLKNIKNKEGEILDINNNIIGIHLGLNNYTIGQRKNLDIKGSNAFYVYHKDIENNKLIVCKKEEKQKLEKNSLILENVNIISGENIEKIEILAKNRYAQSLRKAVLEKISDKTYKIIYKNPEFGITKGQFCVFYKKKFNKTICLGGGQISKIL